MPCRSAIHQVYCHNAMCIHEIEFCMGDSPGLLRGQRPAHCCGVSRADACKWRKTQLITVQSHISKGWPLQNTIQRHRHRRELLVKKSSLNCNTAQTCLYIGKSHDGPSACKRGETESHLPLLCAGEEMGLGKTVEVAALVLSHPAPPLQSTPETTAEGLIVSK